MKAYLEMIDINDPATRVKYLRLVQQLDRVEIDYIAKKRKTV